MATPTPDGQYRKNVAAIVINELGYILICRRADKFHAWQIPQGGIEPGEASRDALLRELAEEIGTAQVEILGELPHTISYQWPSHLWDRGYIGQEQTYFLVRLHSSVPLDLTAHKPPEFDLVDWVSFDEFKGRVRGFKADAYVQAVAGFRDLFPGLIV